MLNSGVFKKGSTIGIATRFKPGQVSLRKGVKLSDETKLKISISKKGQATFTGKRHSDETKLKISLAKMGTVSKLKGKPRYDLRGANNPKWIPDRGMLVKKQERGDPSYREWRSQVWLRDNFKCKISNNDCSGRIEAHHILGWSEYVELRYDVNNGITLCHAHHPRKRAEEKRLIPTFQELVSVSK